MKKIYYVCGLGYDKNDSITDYEYNFGDFETYMGAYSLFTMLQCKRAESFFEDVPELYQMLIQLEECEENDNEINCVGVRGEFWITNPNFKEE